MNTNDILGIIAIILNKRKQTERQPLNFIQETSCFLTVRNKTGLIMSTLNEALTTTLPSGKIFSSWLVPLITNKNDEIDRQTT